MAFHSGVFSGYGLTDGASGVDGSFRLRSGGYL